MRISNAGKSPDESSRNIEIRQEELIVGISLTYIDEATPDVRLRFTRMHDLVAGKQHYLTTVPFEPDMVTYLQRIHF